MTRTAAIILLLLLLPALVQGQYIHEISLLDLGAGSEDYSPVPMEGGFVMSSLRESAGAIDVKDARTGKPLADMYWVPFRNGVAGHPVLFSTNLTTPVNEGPADFTNGGRTICYTRNLTVPKKLSGGKRGDGQLGLFFSDNSNEIWGQPRAFEHNSPRHAVMHPAFSPDGRTLYFTSDMPGGFGGFDLYSSTLTSSGWSDPINLGDRINGPGNEVFPRIQADGTLFFSSDRSGGLGRLDIYESSNLTGTWSTPVALPEPINSPANDVGYTLLPGSHDALMSSDRNGTDRIYFVKRTIPKFRDCKEQQRDNFCYAFKARKHAATKDLPLDHMWDLGDGNRLPGHSVNHCYDDPGTYEVRSLLVDRKTGSVFHVLSVNEIHVLKHEQAFISAPDTVRTGRQVAFDPLRSHLPGITAAEYHWDMGDGVIRRTPRVIHQFKAPGEYTVRLDILSTADGQGRITNTCSTRRMVVLDRYREQEDQSVVALYQDAQGISHQFEFQELPFDHMGMAFEHGAEVTFSVELFASRERVSLNDPRFEEVRRLYRVVEHFDLQRGVYTYSVGETSDMKELYAVFQKVKDLDFLDAEVFVMQMEKLLDMSQLEMASLKDLNKSRLRTDAIQFRSKSAVLDESSYAILDQLLGILEQHRQLHVVIEAHTDDIGTEQANMELSQQRAASVVGFLVLHGISPDRMLPIGHGKNQPIATNKTEEGRSKNRRVEFRLAVKDELPTLVNIQKHRRTP
jgi:outer membrane protein OmpA-like peptidoglycan-associated protein